MVVPQGDLILVDQDRPQPKERLERRAPIHRRILEPVLVVKMEMRASPSTTRLTAGMRLPELAGKPTRLQSLSGVVRLQTRHLDPWPAAPVETLSAMHSTLATQVDLVVVAVVVVTPTALIQ